MSEMLSVYASLEFDGPETRLLHRFIVAQGENDSRGRRAALAALEELERLPDNVVELWPIQDPYMGGGAA